MARRGPTAGRQKRRNQAADLAMSSPQPPREEAISKYREGYSERTRRRASYQIDTKSEYFDQYFDAVKDFDKNFNQVITFGKEIKKHLVITRGEKGAISIINGKVFEVKVKKDLKIIDLTGAGDLFASGFLHGIVNNLSLSESLKKGTELSSKIIQQVGARL